MDPLIEFSPNCTDLTGLTKANANLLLESVRPVRSDNLGKTALLLLCVYGVCKAHHEI